SFEENLAIKNAPPIVRLCLTIGVHFTAWKVAVCRQVDRMTKKGQTLQCEKFVQKVFHVNYFYTNTNNNELE
ncbi:hypothetical protein, partial [Bacillus cereus]|uniref:hypothetical protein n=2 Tax=Bacillus cereus group TaxID=86661 RepID=UPI001A7EB28F